MSEFTADYLRDASPEYHGGFEICTAWEPWIGEELSRNWKQDHIYEMTPEDAKTFFDEWSVNKWLKEKFDHRAPVIAWAGSAAVGLAGIAWVENAYSKTANRVFGVRVYEGYEHEGLARQLSDNIHQQMDSRRLKRQIHFTMSTSNNHAFSIGVRHGYELTGNRANGSQHYLRTPRAKKV